MNGWIRLLLTGPLFVGVWFSFGMVGVIIFKLSLYDDGYTGTMGFLVGGFIGLLAAINAVVHLWTH